MTNLIKNLITLNFDDKYPDENYSLNSCKIYDDIIPSKFGTLNEFHTGKDVYNDIDLSIDPKRLCKKL